MRDTLNGRLNSERIANNAACISGAGRHRRDLYPSQYTGILRFFCRTLHVYNGIMNRYRWTSRIVWLPEVEVRPTWVTLSISFVERNISSMASLHVCMESGRMNIVLGPTHVCRQCGKWYGYNTCKRNCVHVDKCIFEQINLVYSLLA